MNDITVMRDEATAFAANHVVELADELSEWSNTGMLRDGRLREFAASLHKWNRGDNLSLIHI